MVDTSDPTHAEKSPSLRLPVRKILVPVLSRGFGHFCTPSHSLLPQNRAVSFLPFSSVMSSASPVKIYIIINVALQMS